MLPPPPLSMSRVHKEETKILGGHGPGLSSREAHADSRTLGPEWARGQGAGWETGPGEPPWARNSGRDLRRPHPPSAPKMKGSSSSGGGRGRSAAAAKEAPVPAGRTGPVARQTGHPAANSVLSHCGESYVGSELSSRRTHPRTSCRARARARATAWACAEKCNDVPGVCRPKQGSGDLQAFLLSAQECSAGPPEAWSWAQNTTVPFQRTWGRAAQRRPRANLWD